MTSTPKGWWECEVPIKTSNFVALEHEFFKINQFVRKTSAGLDSEEDPRNFFWGEPNHRSAQHDSGKPRLHFRPIMCFCWQYKGRITPSFFYYNMLQNFNIGKICVPRQGEAGTTTIASANINLYARHTTYSMSWRTYCVSVLESLCALYAPYGVSWRSVYVSVSQSLWNICGVSMTECVRSVSMSQWRAGGVSLLEWVQPYSLLRSTCGVGLFKCVRSFSKSLQRTGGVHMSEYVRFLHKSLWSVCGVICNRVGLTPGTCVIILMMGTRFSTVVTGRRTLVSGCSKGISVPQERTCGSVLTFILSFVHSHITLSYRMFESISPNTMSPSLSPITGSKSQPLCPQGQLGRGLSLRSPYKGPTFLDSSVHTSPAFTMSYNTSEVEEITVHTSSPPSTTFENLDSSETSTIPMVSPLSVSTRYPRRKRKCRRWQQRSLEYRRRRSTSKKRLRRTMRWFSDFIRSTPRFARGLLYNWRSSLLVPIGTLLCRAVPRLQSMYCSSLSQTQPISGSVQYLHNDISSDSTHRRDVTLTRQESAFLTRRRADRGGGPGDLIPRYIRPTTLSPIDEDMLPLDNDEDWYPLYVLQASKLATPNLEHPHIHEVITREVFQDMSLASLKQTLTSMGVPFNTNIAPIRHLLPRGQVVSCGYPSRTVPSIDISQLSLEEVLTHIRVVYQRMARLQKAREKVKRRLGSLYGRRCKKSSFLRNIAIDELTSELYNIRAAINQYDDLHKRLCRKSKSRLRETVKRLPKTICVPLMVPPITTSNRFAILDEDNTHHICHWSDLLVLPQPMNMGEMAIPDTVPTSLLHPATVATPLDTLMHLRRDMGTLAPTLPGQVSDMAYGIVGGYKSAQSHKDCTLSVMTLNVNGLTQHKLPMLCRMLQQDHVDVLICVDTRHSVDQTRSFNKKFREQLGAGTTSYFSKDPSRKHGEPGGVGIIVGPRWGTSIDHNSSRTDLSGHGVLTKIRLNTKSGPLSIYGTYWPFVPSSGL